ncbi:hypothetical protein HDU76_007615 [Blyttiomyces sp. JEL0837]|nr:hypothetical protein HDU76_007615 [Blyttiomyces sp. JEL0837]
MPLSILFVPCFSGAPWSLEQLTPLQNQGYNLKTMRLPEDLNNMDAMVNFILEQAKDLDDYILVGDSFGAVCSLAVAIRKPPNLKALVMSGGFAKNPIQGMLKLLASAAPMGPGPIYRNMTLRVHAHNLASKFDSEGEPGWSETKTLELFTRETSHRAFCNRIKTLETIDLIPDLDKVLVPTLILTPEDDKLIGDKAEGIMRERIKGSKEVVLPRTGHMFRFSHPVEYAKVVAEFVADINK